MSDVKEKKPIFRTSYKESDMKVVASDETQDIWVDESMRSLQVLRHAICDKSEKEDKRLESISKIEEEGIKLDIDTKEGMLNIVVQLGRQFNQILEKMDRGTRSNVKSISPDISKDIVALKRT